MTWEELVLKEKEKTYFKELLTFVEKEYQEQKIEILDNWKYIKGTLEMN